METGDSVPINYNDINIMDVLGQIDDFMPMVGPNQPFQNWAHSGGYIAFIKKVPTLYTLKSFMNLNFHIVIVSHKSHLTSWEQT